MPLLREAGLWASYFTCRFWTIMQAGGSLGRLQTQPFSAAPRRWPAVGVLPGVLEGCGESESPGACSNSVSHTQGAGLSLMPGQSLPLQYSPAFVAPDCISFVIPTRV